MMGARRQGGAAIGKKGRGHGSASRRRPYGARAGSRGTGTLPPRATGEDGFLVRLRRGGGACRVPALLRPAARPRSAKLHQRHMLRGVPEPRDRRRPGRQRVRRELSPVRHRGHGVLHLRAVVRHARARALPLHGHARRRRRLPHSHRLLGGADVPQPLLALRPAERRRLLHLPIWERGACQARSRRVRRGRARGHDRGRALRAGNARRRRASRADHRRRRTGDGRRRAERHVHAARGRALARLRPGRGTADRPRQRRRDDEGGKPRIRACGRHRGGQVLVVARGHKRQPLLLAGRRRLRRVRRRRMRARSAAHRHRRGRARARRGRALAGRLLGQGDRAARRLRPRRAGLPRAPLRRGLPAGRGRAGRRGRRTPTRARGCRGCQGGRRDGPGRPARRRRFGRGRLPRGALRGHVRHAAGGGGVGPLPHALAHRRHRRRRRRAHRPRLAAGELGRLGTAARHPRRARDEAARRLPSAQGRRPRLPGDICGRRAAGRAVPGARSGRAGRPRRRGRAQSGRRRGHHGRAG